MNGANPINTYNAQIDQYLNQLTQQQLGLVNAPVLTLHPQPQEHDHANQVALNAAAHNRICQEEYNSVPRDRAIKQGNFNDVQDEEYFGDDSVYSDLNRAVSAIFKKGDRDIEEKQRRQRLTYDQQTVLDIEFN